MIAGRNSVSSNKNWCTPEKYVNVITYFFGGYIKLDPCSNHFSVVKALIEYNNDGLNKNWNYDTIYVNPPYGKDKEQHTTIKNWIYKCYLTNKDYSSSIIALIPVATNTSHWKDYIFNKATAICFLYDTRLKFLLNGEIYKKGAPMACCLIYWGDNYERFYTIFKTFGAVISLKKGII